MPYAPVYDYRWGKGTNLMTDKTILEDAQKFLIFNGKKKEIQYLPKIGDHNIHCGVLQIMRGKRIITYH